MKKVRNSIIILFFLSLNFGFYSCEYYDDNIEQGSYTMIDIIAELPDRPDEFGNLELSNNTNFRYLLYINDSLARLIPSKANNHLIYIETTGGKVFNLKLFKRTDISNNELLNPPAEKIFMQWDVILPVETWDNVRVSWIIDNYEYTENALVTFHYPNIEGLGLINVYSVDVYLNSEFGSKLLSLSPGGSANRLVSFGYQVLLFKYWMSDPNSPGGQEFKGWVKMKPNGNNFSLVLNSFNDTTEFIIPTYFEVYPTIYGQIMIMNHSDKTLFIMANGLKLEDFIILDEGSSTTGLSFVEENTDSPIFKIPIGDYHFEAIIPSNGFEYDILNVTIEQDTLQTWTIE